MFEKITDYKRKLTAEDHGRILRVGRHFRRIAFKDMPYFWETGDDGVINTDKGWKAFKILFEGGEKVLKISK